jgi:uncharacterized protein (TIGR02996 family)
MPVSVSLIELVLVPNASHLWPGDFRDLHAKIEDDPTDKAQWGVIADWLDEHEEPDFAEAWRKMAFKWSAASLSKPRTYQLEWSVSGIPQSVSGQSNANFITVPKETPAAAVAFVAMQLRQLRQEIL